MKKIWNFFSSVWLTIILAVLICLDAAWGSIITMKSPGLARSLDQAVLLPWLAKNGLPFLSHTLWIYILIFLVTLFTVNTVVCTADKIYAIVKSKRPWQAFFPHIVHIGFLVALLGHLAGSAWGFRSYGNTVFKGEVIPVPNEKGLSLRLDSSEVKPSPSGDIESLKTRVTLFEDKKEVLTGDIQINGPLIYRGIAFYHVDQGETPTGFVLDVDGERISLNMDSSIRASDGSTYRLGNLFPDFALDEKGRPYSRSEEFRDPYVEITSGGSTAYLSVFSRGSEVTLNGKKLKLVDYIITPYVTLTINKDPGIWLIITGSSILVAGMVLLLFLRGERGELVRQRKDALES